jgi:hypothetical protein
MTPATPYLLTLVVPLTRAASFTRLVANRIARVFVMVRLSTAGAALEVIEGVAVTVTVTVAAGFVVVGATLVDPQALSASRPLAANKTAVIYLIISSLTE